MKFKIFAIALILVLSALLVVAQYDPNEGLQDNVFLLTGDRQALLGDEYFGGRSSHSIVAVVIIPENVRTEVIEAAWSYAVQYSADGLSLPNYPTAIELLMERHPTWIAAITKGYTIGFNPERAMTDFPDPTLTLAPQSTP